MSIDMFAEIKKTSPDGIESTFNLIVDHATETQDFKTAAEAMTHLVRINLGLPNPEVDEVDYQSNKELWEQLARAKTRNLIDAAEKYKGIGDYLNAADLFLSAQRHNDAVQMFINDGSEESLRSAAFHAFQSQVDLKFGCDYYIKKGQIYRAFKALDNLKPSENYSQEDIQKYGEYLVEAVYHSVLSEVRSIIQTIEGPSPKGDSIPELCEGRDKLSIIVDQEKLAKNYKHVMQFSRSSENPIIIQMGIELNALEARNQDRSYMRLEHENNDNYLRGKKTGDAKYIGYFIAKALEENEGKQDGSGNFYTRSAVELLLHHGRVEHAIRILEQYNPTNITRLKLLNEIGDMKGLAKANKDLNNSVGYALALARQK